MPPPSQDPPLGAALPGWTPPPVPAHPLLCGQHARLEALQPGHGAALFRAFAEDLAGRMWAYMPYGPFENAGTYQAWVEEQCGSADPLFFAIVELESGQPCGVAAYLRIDAKNGCIEIGHLAFAPRLQRTIAATEALFLLLDHAFALGYRRVEWKCNALNAASRRAAQRLGFRYEGLFRQAAVVKGRNRDTAWYAVLDGEWPTLRSAHQQWLAAENFDAAGRQRLALADLTRPHVAARN